jgi:hypothetical protein
MADQQKKHANNQDNEGLTDLRKVQPRDIQRGRYGQRDALGNQIDAQDAGDYESASTDLNGTESADSAVNPDQYDAQDQFGDVDGQDPYSNLDSQHPENRPTPRGDGLEDIEETEYGLAEPLAKPGDKSKKGRDKDRLGTRGSQDQYGYQK